MNTIQSQRARGILGVSGVLALLGILFLILGSLRGPVGGQALVPGTSTSTPAARPSPVAPAPRPGAAEQPAAPVLSPSDIQNIVSKAEADGYFFSPSGAAANGRHGFSAQVSPATGRLRLQSLDLNQHWYVELGAYSAPQNARVEGPEMRLIRPGTEEWYYNDARGLEHGYNLDVRPADAPEGEPLRVHFNLETPLQARVEQGGRGLAFSDAAGTQILRYHGLVARDSTGRSLPATMELAAHNTALALVVQDAGATYPVFIDPIFTTQTTALTSSPPLAGEQYGASVALSGDTLAVGVPHYDSPALDSVGAVDIYRYQPLLQLWSFVKRISPTSSYADRRFGASVALDAGTLMVGAPGDYIATPLDGAAYFYERDAGGPENWGQVAKVNASVPQNLAAFGTSVSLNGGIAAIGEPLRTGGSGNDQGAIHLVLRSPAGVWGTPTQLNAFLPAAGDLYGAWVQVSGNRLAASAPLGQTVATPANAGVVVIHEISVNENGTLAGAPSQPVVDTNPAANNLFGASFTLVGNDLVVGSPGYVLDGALGGRVSVFQHSEGMGWVFNKHLTAPDGRAQHEFGRRVALSGDTLLIGAPMFDSGDVSIGYKGDVGAVYTFERNAEGTNAWGLVEQLQHVEDEEGAQFGAALAISGDTIATGTPMKNMPAVGADAGEVQVYSRRDEAWRVVNAPEFMGSPTADFNAGRSVSIDGTQAVVGIPGAVVAGQSRGIITMLTMNRGGEEKWQGEGMVSLDPQEGELFGYSVAICGEWMLVGAPGRDQLSQTDRGRAYLYRRTAAGWGGFMSFEPPILTEHAAFGASVALTDRWAIIGAPGMNHVFIYDREEGGQDNWDISTIIDETAEGGRFGSSVALEGNTAVVGAPQRAGISGGGAVPAAGQAKVYRAALAGGVVEWNPVKTLPTPDLSGHWGTTGGQFGASVAVRSGLIVAGEPGFNGLAGRAHVFGLNQGGLENWGLVHELTAPAPQPEDRFGAAVAAGQRWLYVGATGRQVAGVAEGQVLVYDRDELSSVLAPEPTSALRHPRATGGDAFGAALSVSGNQLLVGSPEAADEDGNAHAGRYAIFSHQSFAWAQLGTPVGSAANSGDQVGYAVSADGDFMVAGAPYDVVSGTLSAGSVHLYRRSTVASGWLLLKQITAGDLQIGALFGSAVSLDGEVLAVGAPGADGEGAVYVFHRNAGGTDNWGQVRKLTHFTVLAGDNFGAAVSVHEEVLAVGAPQHNLLVGPDAGTVWVFGRHSGGTNVWGYLDQFTAPVQESFAYFGATLAVSHQGILVGTPLATDNGVASGAAHYYKRGTASTEWTHYETILPADGAPNDRFGTSVALESTLAAIGAPGESTFAASSGAAYVFSTNDSGLNWIERQRLVVGQLELAATVANLDFGRSIALAGEQLVVGAPGSDQGATLNTGAAYVFERNHGHVDAWDLVSKLTPATFNAGQRMGAAVDVTNDQIIAGAPEANQGGQIAAGYVFTFSQVDTAYGRWLRRYFGADVDDPLQEAALWGANADSDGDGLSNLLEAYLNTNPLDVNDSTRPVSAQHSEEGGLAMRYRQGKETNGAIGRVKWSRDLETWHRGDSPTVDDFLIITRVLEDHPTHYVMEARVSADQLEDELSLYLRLEVEAP